MLKYELTHHLQSMVFDKTKDPTQYNTTRQPRRSHVAEQRYTMQVNTMQDTCLTPLQRDYLSLALCIISLVLWSLCLFHHVCVLF